MNNLKNLVVKPKGQDYCTVIPDTEYDPNVHERVIGRYKYPRNAWIAAGIHNKAINVRNEEHLNRHLNHHA